MAGAHTAPATRQPPQQKQQYHGRPDEVVVAILVEHADAAAQFLLLHSLDLADDAIEPQRAARASIEPAGGIGRLLQWCFIQAGHDDPVLTVALVAGDLTGLIALGNGFTALASDTNREDAHPQVTGIIKGIFETAPVVLAITDHNQRLELVALALEGARRHRDRLGEIGARLGDERRGHVVQKHARRGVVER